MKLPVITRNPKTRAIVATSLVSTLAVGASSYHIANLTETVVTAGTVVPEGALESLSYIVDGNPFIISIIPAGLRMKIIVGGVAILGVAALGYATYKYVLQNQTARLERIAKKQALDNVKAKNEPSEFNGAPFVNPAYTFRFI